MTPWYSSGGVAIHVGHVLDVLAGLEAESVQTCVTSPPYYGLRSYSTTPQIWGGAPDCDHQLPTETVPGRPPPHRNAQGKTTLQGGRRKLDAQWDAWQASAPGKVLTGGTGTASAKQTSNAGSQYGNAWSEETRTVEVGACRTPSASMPRPGTQYAPVAFPVSSATCTRCGAWRGELGSEPIPDCLAWARGVEPCSACFVCHLVVVFRAVRRVLHPTGTVFCNLGDSYSGSGKGPTGHNGIDDQGQRQGFVGVSKKSTLHGGTGVGPHEKMAQPVLGGGRAVDGLGPKQLLMLPARVALALQADGWVLRSAITWCKKAPMPESVRDRPTNATEMVYLLAKQPTYYYDAEAVRQPAITRREIGRFRSGRYLNNHAQNNHDSDYDPGTANGNDPSAGANLRNFWLLGPEPYSAAHFATFPRKLVEPCVLAGTSARGQCPRCGAPWSRTTEPTPEYAATLERGRQHPSWKGERRAEAHLIGNAFGDKPSGGVAARVTTGWAQSCSCPPAEPVPQIVLDPFLGSGTTAYVARHHGRRAVGIELNESYAQLAADRLRQGTLGLEIY